MISQKEPNFDALFDSAAALQKKINTPSDKILKKYQMLGVEPGQLGDLLNDNRLSPAQKAQLAHSLEGYRKPEALPLKKGQQALGRARGSRKMI